MEKQSEPLNKEEGQKEAQRLFQTASKIFDLRRQIPPEVNRWPSKTLTRETVFFYEHRIGFNYLPGIENGEGLGDVNIEEDSKSYGADTLHLHYPFFHLYIGINTDIESIGKIKNPVYGGTSYYFTYDGQYKKIVSLPKNFEDPRPDLTPYMPEFKSVIGDINAGDFELAGLVLNTIQDKLENTIVPFYKQK